MDSITIKNGTLEDYPAFAEAEKKAWQGSGVYIISREQYETWLRVFPEGLLIAMKEDRVCGHIFSQVCHFNPLNKNDNRSWDEMTDRGYAETTHKLDGNCLYTVSFSASIAGAGKLLARKGFQLAAHLGLEWYSGVCRMPGLNEWGKAGKLELDHVNVERYAGNVSNTAAKVQVNERLFDPTLSVLLRTEGIKYYRVIQNYFSDQQSGNWAAVVGRRV